MRSEGAGRPSLPSAEAGMIVGTATAVEAPAAVFMNERRFMDGVISIFHSVRLQALKGFILVLASVKRMRGALSAHKTGLAEMRGSLEGPQPVQMPIGRRAKEVEKTERTAEKSREQGKETGERDASRHTQHELFMPALVPKKGNNKQRLHT